MNSGPRHRGMSRLKLGLAVRKAGVLYPQVIQLALSHLVLNILKKEIENCTAESVDKLIESNLSESAMEIEKNKNEINCSNNRGESKYYSIFDALVHTCELPKLSDAADKYHESYPSLLSTSKMQDLNDRLIRALDFDVDVYVEVGGGREEVEGGIESIDRKQNKSVDVNSKIVNTSNSINSSSSSSSRNEISKILIACDHVLEALTVLNLTESYKMTPLIAGDQMKQILKNIPKGTMFGEV